MEKGLYFLSGLPGSGSTVLANVLKQNPSVYLSDNTELISVLSTLATTWPSSKKTLFHTAQKAVSAIYEDINAPVLIDKSLDWISLDAIQFMNQLLNGGLKVVVTVRSIPDCMAHLVRTVDPDDLGSFVETSPEADRLKNAYVSLQESYKYFFNCFLFVEYDSFVSDPQNELKRIHKFLNIADFNYNVAEINPKKHTKTTRQILKYYYSVCCQQEFWLEKPKTLPELHDLDLQLAASRLGNLDEGWRLCQKIEIEEPDNHRAAYNRGWYYLRQGDIQKGYQLLDRGRIVKVFGNLPPNSKRPRWDGHSKGVVLLYLEGGLGDQIHQIRYAKNIAERGCKVIACCTGSLASLFLDVEGVSAVVQHGAEAGVYHDYWVQGMSAVVPLGLELKDLNGDPYITKPITTKRHKKRIGLRWQGNPMFEHDHNKLFPHELMFNAVKDADAEFISLQRDEGSEYCPSWVKTVPLGTWDETKQAVASCDLVISACTSVSHLSGAMGVETWVVLPVMPYFLYAIDGEKTPYYDSFKLFRQEVFGEWEAPFRKIKDRLK